MTREEFEKYVGSCGWSIKEGYPSVIDFRFCITLISNREGDESLMSFSIPCYGGGDWYGEFRKTFDKELMARRKQGITQHNSDKFANVWFESKDAGVREDIADLLVGLDDSMFCDCDEESEVDEEDFGDMFDVDWAAKHRIALVALQDTTTMRLTRAMLTMADYWSPYIACRCSLTAGEIEDFLVGAVPLDVRKLVEIAGAIGHRVEINFVKEDGGDDE